MAKNFVSVATEAELASVWVSEFEEGSWAYVASTGFHYSLVHDTGGASPPPGSVTPAAGAPRAGSPNASWEITTV